MIFSIITINLNNASGLKSTIQSVEKQVYKEYEFIIIDGNSNDRSIEIIKEYSDELKFWTSEPDKGIYNAMNKGIKKASGEYCLFLNSGDCLLSDDILEKVSTFINGEDIIYGDAYRLEENGSKTLIEIPASLGLVYFSSNSLVHASTLIKRELFEKFGLYNEENRIVSDWEFLIKTILVNNVKATRIPLAISLIEDQGISRLKENQPVLKKEIARVLAGYFPPSVLSLIDDYKRLKLKTEWLNNHFIGRLLFKLRSTRAAWMKWIN